MPLPDEKNRGSTVTMRSRLSLPASTWEPPAGVTDIYWTDSDRLDAVLFVVMNSLKMKESDQPWLQIK
jgi:hypothetical protein